MSQAERQAPNSGARDAALKFDIVRLTTNAQARGLADVAVPRHRRCKSPRRSPPPRPPARKTGLLGALFSVFQAYEYSHAAFGFSGNIYGANFFMATGFHGFHVLIGTIFLAVCLIRIYAGHFTPERHIGFEAAAWYWHFVDVVWLFLFLAVYVWGG